MNVSEPRFLQIHSLTSYPASLLNRDDAGFAKRIPFGGATRIRVSSQCLKRHWRTFDGEYSLSAIGVPMSVRSRYTFDLYIRKPLVNEGISDEIATSVVEALAAKVLGKSAKAERAEDADSTLRTGQVTVLGRPEIDFLLNEARTICTEIDEPKKAKKACNDRFKGEAKKNLEALTKAASGLDAALFGRMVTSDILARGDAAVHVAHAFTVHEENTESDYFTAVDDLIREQEEDESQGSGHLGNVELTSGLFYAYVVVDVPLLVSNLQGCEVSDWKSVDRTLAAKTVHNLIHLIATVSPGAKLGSTAPYSYAAALAAEFGTAQPCTWANAFLDPVPARGGLLESASQAWGGHVADIDAMYAPGNQRRTAALPSVADNLADIAGEAGNLSLSQLANWVAEQVKE